MTYSQPGRVWRGSSGCCAWTRPTRLRGGRSLPFQTCLPNWAGGPVQGERLDSLRQPHDLDEVAAGVVEDGRGDVAHLGRLLGKCHALRSEPIEFRLNVVDRE